MGASFPRRTTSNRAHVAVLGSEAKTKLFGGLYPIGQRIRLNGISFEVIGVLDPKMQEEGDNVNRQVYIPFSTMADIKDPKYLDGIWLNYNGDHAAVQQAIRNTLAAMHNFRPSDHQAIFVADLEQQLTQFKIVTIALEVLLLFIGALTLGIAGIGLMNIMLVAVQQRTKEIGIEKALGARKRHILIQFLAESLVITGIGGIGGHRAGLCGFDRRGAHHVLQRHGLECSGCGYPAADFSYIVADCDRNSGGGGAGERDDSGDQGGESESY